MTNTEVVPNLDVPDIRVARIATADSLSSLSQLEYHLGYLAGDKGHIYIRLWKNTGNGKFNTDWLALADIEKALAKIPTEDSFAADAFAPLFQGRSVNSRYFTIACLIHAGILHRTDDGYTRATPTELWRELQVAIDADANLLPASMVQSAGHIVVPVFKTTKSGKKAGRPVGSGSNA
jgi:hypothetical protein